MLGAIPTGTPDAGLAAGVVDVAGALAFPMCPNEELTWDWDPPKDQNNDGTI